MSAAEKDVEKTATEEAAGEAPPLDPTAIGTLLAAWLMPGAGHFLLGRRGRALCFFVIIAVALATGVALDGNLHRILPNQPLTILGTLASMGTGIAYLVLRYASGYTGDVEALGYEYGTAFLITAGLMNFLLVLDVWDMMAGRKE